MVPLKYLSNFWRTVEMSLIGIRLNQSKKYNKTSNTASNQETKFEITDTNFYFTVLNLSTLDDATLLQQLKLGFKRTINWNKC